MPDSAPQSPKPFRQPFRTAVLAFIYEAVLKPIFFSQDPERVHDRITYLGQIFGLSSIIRSATRLLLSYRDPILAQTVAGIRFENPVGLAAGFDKDAKLMNILPAVGFGYEEIGSITGMACAGNARPRLWRLPKSKSLVVYYGLKNEGAEAIARRLQGRQFDFPLGVSVAKTNSRETVPEKAGIEDYVKAYATMVYAGIGDYYTINISCPNAYGGEPFVEAYKLERLLQALRAIPSKKPIFLKMPAELSRYEIDNIVTVARRYKITGFICTNLAKSKDNPRLKDERVPEQGGFSGKVVEELSNELLSYLYAKTGREFVLIGCGGVFSAADAYRKIKLGASLIQMITGMIYEGPQVIGAINRELADMLRRDGYATIREAVGAAHRAA